MNISGIFIQGNQLEGSTGYIEGYAKNAVISNNPHYECGNVRLALFMLTGCDNVTIDLNISGQLIAADVPVMYCNEIINSTGACNGLTVTGNITDVYKDAFWFGDGGNNIDIRVNADRIGLAGTGYSFINLNGGVFDGLTVKGSITSPNSTFTAIKRNGNNVVNYDVSGLMLSGTYIPGTTYTNVVYHNLNEQNVGIRRIASGSYTGNGGAAVNVYLGYKPNCVHIFSSVVNALAISNISATTQVPATGITFTASGFTYQGIANNSSVVYSWMAN